MTMDTEPGRKAAAIRIHERDVGSKLCQSCAACCRILLKIPGTDSRYRTFLRTVGFQVVPAPAPGQADCCDKVHDVELDMGFCKHLDVKADQTFACRLHGTSAFPQLCEQFNCVSWAKANNNYSDGNPLLRHVQSVWEAQAKG